MTPAMGAPIETVAVVNPRGGFMLINRGDFDPRKHRLYEATPPPAAPRQEKRGRGRPAEVPGETMCSVATCLPKAEADALYRIARRERMTVSEYLRDRLRALGVLVESPHFPSEK